ncbi:Fic family protein [Allochromatium humboldtianum]|uniref:Fic family protein n=1 Tax=Allochromatium humboldtianum TaxID=504901 RepID=A0A850RPY3_9GAMM|nr:Fic family protein [Allochromatium humboldtianum]NVZ11551.1 Fic family protein [Allochromatium humboldtianum]
MKKTTLSLLAENSCWDKVAALSLHDLGVFCGKQELYATKPNAQLRRMCKSIFLDSSLASCRLDGVTLPQNSLKRLSAVSRPRVLDSDEEDVISYCDAIKFIYENAKNLPINHETICQLHALACKNIDDSGQYRSDDRPLIGWGINPAVPVERVVVAMNRLFDDWNCCLEDRSMPPLLAAAAFNLDFFCIHPFRKGNSRVSRLLWLLQSLQLGYDVGRYISLDLRIELIQDRYYETLQVSSQGWDEAKHNPWSYINYMLSIMELAYDDFQTCMLKVKGSLSRANQEQAVIKNIDYLLSRPSCQFTIRDLVQSCPGISFNAINFVLRKQQQSGAICCVGSGRNAYWTRGLTEKK